MKDDPPLIPIIVPIVTIFLGLNDLFRGVMHTFLIVFSAENIAHLDLKAAHAGDMLQLLNAFGISNYLTGIMLITIAYLSRKASLMMLGLLPLIYGFFAYLISLKFEVFTPPKAAFYGKYYMLGYLTIALITFFIGVIATAYKKKHLDLSS